MIYIKKMRQLAAVPRYEVRNIEAEETSRISIAYLKTQRIVVCSKDKFG